MIACPIEEAGGVWVTKVVLFGGESKMGATERYADSQEREQAVWKSLTFTSPLSISYDTSTSQHCSVTTITLPVVDAENYVIHKE